MAEILEYDGDTSLEIPPKKMLKNISEEDGLEVVLVLAIKNGQFISYGSEADMHKMNYLCDKFKHNLLSGVYTGD